MGLGAVELGVNHMEAHSWAWFTDEWRFPDIIPCLQPSLCTLSSRQDRGAVELGVKHMEAHAWDWFTDEWRRPQEFATGWSVVSVLNSSTEKNSVVSLLNTTTAVCSFVNLPSLAFFN